MRAREPKGITEIVLQPDHKLDYAGAPLVVFAGREWFIPRLALRQSRIVVPGLLRLLPVLETLQENPAALAEAQFEELIAVVHAALTRAYPELGREAFLDLEITVAELAAAVPVIMRQTGFFKPAGAAAGEAGGETASLSAAPQSNSTN